MLHAFLRTLIAAALLAPAHALAQLPAHGPQAQGAQTPPAAAGDAARALRVFDSRGAAVTLDQLVEAAGSADVVFLGEQHNDAGAHLLEAELLRRAYARHAQGDEKTRRTLVLSLEFFERDVQVVLDEYLAGLISERHFLAASRPWKNYQTDYRPLVEFARAHRLPVVAANAPARYVSRVSYNGPGSLSALTEEARRWLPPLPVAPASPAYADKFHAFMRGQAEAAAAQTPADGAAAANPHAQAAAPRTCSTRRTYATPRWATPSPRASGGTGGRSSSTTTAPSTARGASARPSSSRATTGARASSSSRPSPPPTTTPRRCPASATSSS